MAQRQQALAAEQKIAAQRFTRWEEGFQQKAQECKWNLNTSLSPVPVPPQGTKETYANSEQFKNAVLELWHSRLEFAEVRRHSRPWEEAWKSARNQNRPEAPQMERVLMYSYQQAYHSHRTVAEKESQSYAAEQESLLQQQKQQEATLAALDKALGELRLAPLPPQDSKESPLPSPTPLDRKESKVQENSPALEKRWGVFLPTLGFCHPSTALSLWNSSLCIYLDSLAGGRPLRAERSLELGGTVK